MAKRKGSRVDGTVVCDEAPCGVVWCGVPDPEQKAGGWGGQMSRYNLHQSHRPSPAMSGD